MKCEPDVRVAMPISSNPNFYPNWFLDNETGELTGFYIQYLEELFKAMNMNYTLLQDLDKGRLQKVS